MAPGSRPCRYSASIRSSKYLHSLSLCRMSFSWSSERPTRHCSAAAFLSLTRVAISGPVQRLAGEREEGLADALGQRRMRMDQRGNFGGNGLPVHDQHPLGDEVRDVRPHHVNAEHGTAGLLGDDLHHSALADDVRLPDALEVQPLDLHLVAALDRLRLGQADGSDLGGAVRDAWDAGVLDRRNRLAADALGHGVTLGERHVRELQRRRSDVADAVAFGYVLDGCAGVGRDPALAKRAGDLLGGVLVLERRDPRQCLDQRDLGAHRAVEARELQADRAGPDDHDRAGDGAVGERLVGCDDPIGALQPRQEPRARARCEDHVGRLERPAIDLDRWPRSERGGPVDDVDLPRFHQAGEARHELVHDLRLERLDLRPVGLPTGADAPLDRPVDGVHDGGRLQQRLGGDAYAQQTRAAESLVAFHKRDTLAEQSQSQGAGVSTRPGPDHHDVVGVGHPGRPCYSPCRFRPPRVGGPVRTMRRMTDAELRHSPLEDVHRRLGAKLGAFGGWWMPIEYAGTLSEHRAVRERAGLFDLSHLGKVDLVGPSSLPTIQRLFTNDARRAGVGTSQYHQMLNERGGIEEDLFVYRLGEERWFVVPNAANKDRVVEALRGAAADEAAVIDHDDWGFLAVQGPRSREIVTALWQDAVELPFRGCRIVHHGDAEVVLARTGYTGERGYELFASASVVADLWDALMMAGAGVQLEPCGLAGRDVIWL